MTERVAVLDLGDSKVVCLVASSVSGQMTIEAISVTACRGLRKGEIVDVTAAANAVDVAIRRVQQELGETIHSLYVGIGGARIEGIQAQGLKPIVPKSRQISHQDVLDVVNHSRAMVLPPDREQIQAIPREFRVDGARDVKSPVGMTGAKLEAVTYIVTADLEQIQGIERVLHSIGKELDQVILLPMASGLAILNETDIGRGTAVVDIGGTSTEIGIFEGGSLYGAGFVPIGGQLVTSDLSKVLKTSPDEAERLKLDHGVALESLVEPEAMVEIHELGQSETIEIERAMLARIIESRMQELAGMAKQHLVRAGFARSNLVLTGGGAQLTGTESLFQGVFPQMTIRTIEPEIGPKVPNPVGMAAAVGLARFALQCREEGAPISQPVPWTSRVRNLFGR